MEHFHAVNPSCAYLVDSILETQGGLRDRLVEEMGITLLQLVEGSASGVEVADYHRFGPTSLKNSVEMV